MKARQLEKLGIPPSLAKLAKWLAQDARRKGMELAEVRRTLAEIVDNPDAYREHPHFAELATAIAQRRAADANASAAHARPARTDPAPWRQWGRDLDANAIQQMQNACALPVSVRGALMPDAHVGYGLPIGGVLATDNAVIPYAVGVDIACRMKLTVLDLPAKMLESQPDRLVNAIERETRFGIGSAFEGRGTRREHEVLDEDWSFTPITRQLKDKAAAQLGTSGSGNHFVEFGTFEVDAAGAEALQLPGAGTYLALLSHSGSRGPGATIADHYSKLAMDLHPELPRELRHLAWLDLSTHEGQEYWHAMQLMGRFAHANHECIHRTIVRHLGARAIGGVENHHNFAWRETHVDPDTGQTRTVIVHRKGATPAAADVLGVIPGSMASPCYVVRGKGSEDAMNSAAHGAGRVMSRTQAKNTYRWPQVKDYLKRHGVTLLSAGLDEVPFVYKDIDTVMAAQNDLVDVVARFDPKLVKMAPAGERPED
jgi:tRNA-splicing ligase RtcB (3'-phosphate/5'-hydroxy nucleic acid ligase)